MLETRQLQRLHVGPVDLAVAAGTCIAIEGRSGSGKSVLLRAIADLDPHAGDVAFAGRWCSQMPAPSWRRQVTYVSAAPGWWHDRVGPHFRELASARALLAQVGLPEESLDWEVARLSTGERQRIALLRAMTPENRVLLLDEPTSGLDAESIALVEALLRQRVAAGTTLLLVTHDPAQAERLALRRYQLADGQLHERT